MRRYNELMIKCEDIYLLMSSLLSIGWKRIRPTSINRVIYLSAVLYSFVFPEEKNIFQEIIDLLFVWAAQRMQR